jgi:diacylglycerol kinase (ATP)
LDNDGLLEVCLVHPVSHITFIKLIGSYKKGRHLDEPRFKKHITYCRGKNVKIEAPEGFIYSLDGELISQNEFTVEVVQHAVRFAVPQGATPLVGDLHQPCCNSQEESALV